MTYTAIGGKHGEPHGQNIVTGGAKLSPCLKYRYWLTRTWDIGSYKLPFVLLNPSTADHTQDDPTVRRCMGFARREGYGGIVIVNLYAYRATSPATLKTVRDPYGPENPAALREVAGLRGRPVVCGWGANAAPSYSTIWLDGAELMCLGRTASGGPRHPLYLPGDAPLEPYAI